MIDEDDEATEETPAQWSWINLGSIFVAWWYGLFMITSNTMKQISEAMESHVEWKTSRKDFAQRAALEIEALTRLPETARSEVKV